MTTVAVLLVRSAPGTAGGDRGAGALYLPAGAFQIVLGILHLVRFRRIAVGSHDNDGDPLEIECRRRRLRLPFKTGRPPWIGPGDGAVLHGQRFPPPLFVWVDYAIHSGLGTAEITYRYPKGELIQLTNGWVLAVDDLKPGIEFVLQLGGAATVTKVKARGPGGTAMQLSAPP